MLMYKLMYSNNNNNNICAYICCVEQSDSFTTIIYMILCTHIYLRTRVRTHAHPRTFSTCPHMRTLALTHACTHTHTRAIYIMISLYIYISTRTHYRTRAYIHTPHTRSADTHLTHISLMHSYEDALMCMYYVATL